MKFKSGLIVHVPDANPNQDKTELKTETYSLEVRMVQNQKQAVDAAREMADQGVDSLMLCPGFTNEDVAKISQAVGKKTGVTVARGDGPSSKIAQEAMAKAGWFNK
ncbi:MAG TPA: DUF6506 family protein [bacterium]|nr:DUF6506 family protein [bacterium]